MQLMCFVQRFSKDMMLRMNKVRMEAIALLAIHGNTNYIDDNVEYHPKFMLNMRLYHKSNAVGIDLK